MQLEKADLLVADAQTAGSAYLRIADEMERLISSEEWRLGRKLPSTKELAAIFEVTPPTVQRSLARLAARGFIKRTRRKGTFVTYGDPFEGKVAVVLGRDPLKIDSRYYSALLDGIRRSAALKGFPVKYYLDIDESDYGRTIRELEADIEAGEVSTVVEMHNSQMFADWKASCQLPVHFARMPALDFKESARLGMDYLYKRGFKKTVFISMYSRRYELETVEKEGLAAALAENPGSTAPLFLIGGDVPRDGYEIVLDVLASGKERPDALFIHHDVMTGGALQAIAEGGLKIPKDIALLTHSNAGVDFLSRTPLTKVEFDPADVASLLFERLGAKDRPERGVSSGSLVKPRLLPGLSCGE